MTADTYRPIADEQEPCRDEKGVCQETRHEHFDFDACFEEWQAEQAERYWGGM